MVFSPTVLTLLLATPEQQPMAAPVAARLGLQLLDAGPMAGLKARAQLQFLRGLDPHQQTPLALIWDQQGLQLIQLHSGVRVGVDFAAGKAAHRRQYGGGSGQLIAKAAGLRAGFKPRLLDATAGLGQDSFVFASLGCSVTMLERSAIVQALLADGLARAEASAGPELQAIVARMQLCHSDGLAYLQQLADAPQRPHIVYLDPMFPERKKSAQVKKEMQSFQQLLGPDMDADGLLQPALQAALGRVVVKRPKGAGFLAQREPDLQYRSKTGRFDVYINASLDKVLSSQ
ncbi:MAG: class I SAM-dependent methyltransferase [Cellvibrionaceae bacterium]|nr:class I SAM-dependent methyltransferase [Cellvibrionaceae bacterium]MCV6627007.1 class I SAM-dependent methyltransferase [Cellvibrionaceae bacterium]